ncbi:MULTISPECIES: hypothetical protein [Actinomycetes]|uniref:hypothetical protein n=1 Tax=Actinomycetes TaxID=1760 RepID=UPI001133A227|nr:hypothetical protein DV517_09240 [Streptomyces sp. S816]
MVRRTVAWVVTVVLLVEALGIGALNWFLGVVVERQKMSMAGLDPHLMSTSSKVGGVVFGLYFLLCALVALLVAVRDRAPAGFGRVVLISAAVVHGLLGAFAWGLVNATAFLVMIVVLALLVLLLVSYDRDGGPAEAAPGGDGGTGGDPRAADGPLDARTASPGEPAAGRPAEPQDGDDGPQDAVPERLTRPVPTTP